MKKIAILGSTGSIGTQTLEVARENGDLQITALAAGNNIELLEKQIREGLKGIEDIEKIVVAYEPVWAIGTGRTATAAQANETIGFIRKTIGEMFCEKCAAKLRIQYGGSMNAGNCKELMAMEEIDGGLIGGASLKAPDFAAIVNFDK